MYVQPQCYRQIGAVAGFWKEFNLESRRGQLDEVGLKIAQHQESSQQSRRQLAEATKELKRTQAGQISSQVSSLLKKYQEEIDRLSRRSRHSETAYLELYKSLYEAPDPAPALLQSLQSATSLTDLEATCRKQAQELAEFRAESKHIKNQDLTIRKLEEKVKQLMDEIAERDDHLETAKQEAEQKAVSDQLQEAESKISSLKSELQKEYQDRLTVEGRLQKSQNQLFALQAKNEELQAGEESAIDMTLVELDRLQKQVMELENEKRLLQQKLASYGDGTYEALKTRYMAAQTEVVALKEELSIQRKLANRYRQENEVLEQDVRERDSTWEGRVEALRQALKAQESHSEQLELELGSRPTQKQMDDLRKQLQAMQSVMVNLNMLDESNPENKEGGMASLEVMLASRNRALEHQVTVQKLEVVELRNQIDSVTSELSELKGELEGKTELVKQLEEDLVAAENVGHGGSGQQGGEGDKVPQLGGGDGEADNNEGGGDTSMVQVLVSQRERLRKRVQSVEEQLATTQQQLKEAKSRADASYADNVSLVERLKFVQGYRKDINAKKVERGGVAEARYEKELEKGLDPFNEFRGRAREVRKSQMPIPDRVLYSIGGIVTSSSTARTFAFFYGLILHILVLVMIFRMAHHSMPSLHTVEKLCQQHHFQGGGMQLQ
eukprot:TRINITY_DN670_c0_g2_i2.p1 TRINITY_DN670_c0_g2~~TRINITY_DN670_c0_g2_i2.p1  ORF type:complete len:683 (-),score=134.99 TRINITY_DN670_c0_g2_i2:879-2882(-)